MSTTIETSERPREHTGWRAGRPTEDPYKLKRWGFITARPSEYLVHVRGGRVRGSSSGQGATCFKLPWDSVAVVPTSLQRMQFTADQVTLERVGVAVTGLAVYRIAEPLLAYRVLNFSFPERAQEKLEQTLAGMFVGACRRLIANLSVDDCLQKRKAALADELLREVAPIVGGEGRPDDPTTTGWGVVIDTIEIQEVRVLSERVFDAMQAPFRAALDRRAREARAEAEKEVAAREAECRRVTEEARIRTELALREKTLEREIAELNARDALERAEVEARAREAVARAELAATQARAEIESHAVRAEAAARGAELARVEWAAETERRRALAEIARLEGLGLADVAQAQAQAAQVQAEAQARVVTAQKLPELAAAVGQRFGEVRVTQIGDGGSPFGAVAQAVAAVVELARGGGASRAEHKGGSAKGA